MKPDPVLLAFLLACAPAGAADSPPAAAAAAPTAASVCESRQGIWNTSNDTCAVGRDACESLGIWEDGLGCVLPSINASNCNGGGGLRAIGEACVIITMSVDETTP